MERKLIKQGGGGYTIYLPKKWVDSKGVNEGDSVEVIEKDNVLIISKEKRGKNVATLSIDFENKRNLVYLVTQLYRKGFDEIKIENIDEHSFSEIKKVVKNSLLGFEITDNNKENCKIENISEPTDQKFEVLIRKMFLVIDEMTSLTAQDGASGKYSHLDEIDEYRVNQDKFALFCRRVLSKEKNELNPVVYWEFLNFITHSSHLLQYAYSYSAKNKLVFSKENTNLFKDLREQFKMVFEAYINKDISLINKIYSLRKDYLFEKSINNLEKSKGKESVIASYLRELFRQVQIGASPLLGEYLQA